MPHAHLQYKINVNEILKNHKLTLSDDQSAHMVPLPPFELPEMNAFMTITRLTSFQAQNGHISGNCKCLVDSNIPLVNQNMSGLHQSTDVHPTSPH